MTAFCRVSRFYAVGALGVAVQLGSFVLLTRAFGWHYVAATAAAVEVAVVHNFMWHDRWTWAGQSRSGRAGRLWRFHVSNGIVSVLANVLVTRALVEAVELRPVVANALAIASASVANFISADQFVFRAHQRALPPVDAGR